MAVQGASYEYTITSMFWWPGPLWRRRRWRESAAANTTTMVAVATSLFLAALISSTTGGVSGLRRHRAQEQPLRCYVCGGNTDRSCNDFRIGDDDDDDRDSGGGGLFSFGSRSPYRRPPTTPPPRRNSVTGLDDRQWEVCNDIITNKGCIKQVVNNVVVLRGCWFQGTHMCIEDGGSEVCTCTTDLCNSAPRTRTSSSLWLTALAASGAALFLQQLWRRTL